MRFLRIAKFSRCCHWVRRTKNRYLSQTALSKKRFLLRGNCLTERASASKETTADVENRRKRIIKGFPQYFNATLRIFQSRKSRLSVCDHGWHVALSSCETTKKRRSKSLLVSFAVFRETVRVESCQGVTHVGTLTLTPTHTHTPNHVASITMQAPISQTEV